MRITRPRARAVYAGAARARYEWRHCNARSSPVKEGIYRRAVRLRRAASKFTRQAEIAPAARSAMPQPPARRSALHTPALSDFDHFTRRTLAQQCPSCVSRCLATDTLHTHVPLPPPFVLRKHVHLRNPESDRRRRTNSSSLCSASSQTQGQTAGFANGWSGFNASISNRQGILHPVRHANFSPSGASGTHNSGRLTGVRVVVIIRDKAGSFRNLIYIYIYICIYIFQPASNHFAR
jgi:hypothetical protein